MVEHHSPTPARAEAEGDIRLATPASDQRAGPTVSDRLEAVERAVREVGRILTQQLPQRLSEESDSQRTRLSELAVELGGAFRRLVSDLEQLRGSVADVVAASEERVSVVITAAEERVSGAVSRTAEAVQARAEEGVEALGSRVAAEAATIRERVEGDGAALREQLDRATAALGERLEEAAAAIRGLTDELAQGLGRLEPLRAVPARLGEGMDAVRDSVAEIAAVHAGIEERLAAVAEVASGEAARARLDETSEVLATRLGEAAGSMRWEVQEALARVHEQLTALTDGLAAVRTEADQRASALQEGLERVDKLAEAVETIGRRRGFKQVVESDLRLREEQAAMTDRLAEAGQVLSAQVEEVRAELEELRRAARDAQAGVLAEGRRRVVDELLTDELVQTMIQRMRETFDQRFQELLGRVEARLGQSASVDDARRGLFRRRRT